MLQFKPVLDEESGGIFLVSIKQPHPNEETIFEEIFVSVKDSEIVEKNISLKVSRDVSLHVSAKFSWNSTIPDYLV